MLEGKRLNQPTTDWPNSLSCWSAMAVYEVWVEGGCESVGGEREESRQNEMVTSWARTMEAERREGEGERVRFGGVVQE